MNDAAKPIPWTFILSFGLSLSVALLAGYRAMVINQAEIDRLAKQVELLEGYKDRASEKLTMVDSEITILKIKFTSMEAAQQRIESAVREGSSEIRSSLRELSKQLEHSAPHAPRP